MSHKSVEERLESCEKRLDHFELLQIHNKNSEVNIEANLKAVKILIEAMLPKMGENEFDTFYNGLTADWRNYFLSDIADYNPNLATRLYHLG